MRFGGRWHFVLLSARESDNHQSQRAHTGGKKRVPSSTLSSCTHQKEKRRRGRKNLFHSFEREKEKRRDPSIHSHLGSPFFSSSPPPPQRQFLLLCSILFLHFFFFFLTFLCTHSYVCFFIPSIHRLSPSFASARPLTCQTGCHCKQRYTHTHRER